MLIGSDSGSEEYYTLYMAYMKFLNSPLDASASSAAAPGSTYINLIGDGWTRSSTTLSAPVAPNPQTQASNPASYLEYLIQYQAYLDQVGNVAKVTPPVAPTAQSVKVINASTTDSVTVLDATPAVTDNTPSPVSSVANPLPLPSASLAGGSSSSFRLVGRREHG